jgi:tetratricopeptide (TPR) repeat protein
MRVTYIFALLLMITIGEARGQSVNPGSETPAGQKIAWARKEVAANPRQAQPYNDLAVALIGRAHETGDPAYYDQAETALESALKIEPENVESLKARAMIFLGRHQYEKAIELTRKLNTEDPDDVLIYGLLADGLIERGDYDQAVDAAQWMLNLRHGNVPGLLRAARLRWLHGQREGALSLYSQAYEQASPAETEQRASILVQMADIQIVTDHLDEAATLLQSALQALPGYVMALESSARLETARKDYAMAVTLLRERNQHFPTLESRYAWAQALERAGENAQAQQAFAEFEQDASRAADADDNANRDLILYYASRGHRPQEALRIAHNEADRRHDVWTLDAYAWALCVNGRFAEAQQPMKAALIFGTQDAAVLYHAGVIALNFHDESSAARYLKASIALNSTPDVAEDARRLLDGSKTAAAAPVEGR